MQDTQHVVLDSFVLLLIVIVIVPATPLVTAVVILPKHALHVSHYYSMLNYFSKSYLTSLFLYDATYYGNAADGKLI